MLITSYDLLRIDAEDFTRREFYCCALDEAQYVKNHATKTARAAKRVRADCVVTSDRELLKRAQGICLSIDQARSLLGKKTS